MLLKCGHGHVFLTRLYTEGPPSCRLLLVGNESFIDHSRRKKKESGFDPTSLYLHDILDGSISLILPHSNSTLSSQTSLDLLLSSHVLFSLCCWKHDGSEPCPSVVFSGGVSNLWHILSLLTSHKILICCLLLKTIFFGSNLAHTHVLSKQAEWVFPIYNMHRMVKWTHETR